MKISYRCMPVGSLPYDNNELATKMLVKLFERIPFLAMLPKASISENLYQRSLFNIPGIKFKDKKIIFKNNTEKFKNELLNLDIAFNTPTPDKLDHYQIETFFSKRYFEILERVQPAETIINLLGPFSVSQLLTKNSDEEQFLADKCYRKLVIQAVTVKALWIINKIKDIAPNTTPVIMLEEPFFNQYGNIKRETEEVTRDVIINMFSKVFQKIQENGGLAGIQCFEKCDWQLPIEAGVNIISFDAYNNPNNLNIITDKVNEFLAKGGRINWAIIPVINENTVKTLTIDKLYDLFIKTIENAISAGIDEKLAYNHAAVSVQGNIDHLPIIFAEKALILASQLGKRIPFKS